MSVDDPILAAIAAHRVAHAAWRRLAGPDATGSGTSGSDSDGTADLLRAEAEAAAWALIDVTPATPAGLLALATYAGDFVVAGNDWPDGWDRRFYAVVVRWPEP